MAFCPAGRDLRILRVDFGGATFRMAQGAPLSPAPLGQPPGATQSRQRPRPFRRGATVGRSLEIGVAAGSRLRAVRAGILLVSPSGKPRAPGGRNRVPGRAKERL